MDAIRWVYRMGPGNPQHVRQLTDVGAGVSLAPNSPVRAGPLAGDQAAVPPQDGAGRDQPGAPTQPRNIGLFLLGHSTALGDAIMSNLAEVTIN